MLQGKSLVQLAAEIERQKVAKKDFIASTSQMNMVITEPDENGKRFPRLGIADMDPLAINEIAHNQIGAKLEIPSKYYDRLLNEEPELLAENVNTWLHKKPSQRMIRTLDGTARAYLSDRYRRIDNAEVAEAVLPIISGMKDATVESCEITESRMYLKVLNPRIQTEITQGDVVQSGILITNSEVGMGSVSVMPLVYRLVCKNGMIAADSGMRKFHTGRINEADGNMEIFRSVTIEADDKAFIMKLQDIVHATAEIIQFERIVSAMKLGTETKITSPDVPKVVQLASKNYGLTEYEGKGVLDHLIRGGDLSLYGLANSVTHTAQDVKNYDRSTELEMVGWQMLNMPRTEWHRLNTAA